MCAHLVEVYLARHARDVISGHRHQVGGEQGSGLGIFGDDEAVSDRRVRRDHGLYFAEFDAEATDLDLLVGSSDKFELAGDVAADQLFWSGTAARRG